ncbi:MAG: alpha/beta hydrolase [Lewinella sp.]|nr:alpha/beta hydrolase [Lewinella sp.]
MQQWRYPYPVRTVEVLDGIPIAFLDEGQGPPLVLLHGLGSNAKGFWKTIEGLKSTFRCIALDLPGYGRSGQGDYPFSMHFFARAVQSFLARLDLHEVTLAGHSMGGQIALQTALEDTSRLHSLVLLAPAGFETFSESHRRWFDQIYQPALLEKLPESQIRRNFHLNFVDFPPDAEFMITDRMRLREERAAYRYFCRLQGSCVKAMLAEPIFDELPRIELPVLVIFGQDDFLIPNRIVHPFSTTREIASQGTLRLPAGELHMLEGCGHFPQWECADEVNAAIKAFLNPT